MYVGVCILKTLVETVCAINATGIFTLANARWSIVGNVRRKIMLEEINDYQPLCDIKNCENPQCGEIYELPILGVGVHNLVARIHPCHTHIDILNIVYKPKEDVNLIWPI